MDQTKVFTKHKNFLDQTYLIKSRSTSSLRGSKKDCLPIVWTLHVLQVFCFSIKLYEVKINSNRLIIVLTIRWDRNEIIPWNISKQLNVKLSFSWKLIFTYVVAPPLHLGSKKPNLCTQFAFSMWSHDSFRKISKTISTIMIFKDILLYLKMNLLIQNIDLVR